MFRKNYLMFLATAALFLLSSTIIFAQGLPIKGKIQIKKADGSVAPMEGATIDIYRTDAATGKLAAVKTDAQGMFISEGVPASQTFAIVISAPTIKPELRINAKGGQTVSIDVTPGDGGVPSEEEVRDAVAVSAVDPNSAEGKKALAEREKKLAEFNAKNEKAQASNAVLNRTLKEGNDAFAAQNYDVAIAKFDEGYNAAPDYLGSAPVMLDNKGKALWLRGYSNYKKATTDTANKASLMESAKKDFTDAIAAYQQTLSLVSKAPATDTNAQKNKAIAQAGIVESYRLMVGTRADQTKTKELAAAANEYAAVETDAAARAKTMVMVADTLRLAGNSADAVPIYRKVLETDPNNANAMGGLGLSLFDVGAGSNPPDKAQMQEGLNLMEKFAQTSPPATATKDELQMREDVKGAVDYLKNTEKLTPQKVTTTKKKS
ncbi:MAG: hypothetical protein ACR2N3_17660 [Pyrinomonadaceae bacterium]